MTLTVEELVSRNDSYAAFHQPLPTFKELDEAGAEITKLAIVSCCDPRIIPEKYFDLAPGEAIVWRNIAGHPQACYQDIAALDTFLGGFKQLIIVHHTGMSRNPISCDHAVEIDRRSDCGSTMWSDEQIRSALQKQFPAQHTELSGMSFGAVSTRSVSATTEVKRC